MLRAVPNAPPPTAALRLIVPHRNRTHRAHTRQDRGGLLESVPGLRRDERESAGDNEAGARVQRLPLHRLVVPSKVHFCWLLPLCYVLCFLVRHMLAHRT